MDNSAFTPPDPKGDAYKAKLAREAMDTIAVYNILDTDYILDWAGDKFRFPAHTEKRVPRYIARNFFKEVKDLYIHQLQTEEVEKHKEKLIAKGADNVVYQANQLALNTSKYRTDNVELMKELKDKIWLGVVEKYGLDVPPPAEATKVDLRSPEEKVLSEDMDKPYKTETPVTITEEKYPINKKKLVEEVSK
jgi:hypothetical protein